MKDNQKTIKNIIFKNSIPQPLTRSNEVKKTIKNKNDSSHSFSNIPSNKHLENTFKDSLEASISESKTNILIPDSLNNTKSSIGNPNIKKNNKKKDLYDSEKKKNISNGEKIENEENFSSSKNNEENTKKIDYRFYTNYPITIIKKSLNDIKNKEKNRYWLAVYDKLIKKKNILKILNYYEKGKNEKNENVEFDINQDCIKEQLLIIKDFDIYFLKEYNKPFIKYIKGNCIFTKLYLLTIEEINYVLNYINRYKLSFDISNIKFLQEKGNFQKFQENFKNFPYNMIYHMGNYMNINIYGFSNFNLHSNKNILSYDYLNQKFPSNKKIAKLVKILMIHYPKYSFNFFVCYLLSKIKFENFNEKTNEIKNLVYSINKSLLPLHNTYYNNIINNSIMHSSYSPLSHYDDEITNEKPILKNYTENNYQQIIGENIAFQCHTIDNCTNKYINNKKKNNIINNKNIKINSSDKKKPFKKHTESVYLNGYVGKDTQLLFQKDKNNKKEQKKTIKQFFCNFKVQPSLIINENDKKKKDVRQKNVINKTKSFSKNNKINFPKFVQVKKKNTNYIENGILKKIENEKKEQNEKNENNLIDGFKNNNKSHINHISKIIINTKSEETKIGTINKETTNYINNSCREEINRENTGIFVVNKRMITDIQDYIDDNSSLILSDRSPNGKISIYMTPEKKKQYKYYS